MSDEQLKALIETLPNSWFTQSADVILSLENRAQNEPASVILHDYLAHYFHLAGDYEKAAFYAIHREPQTQLTQKDLFSQAVVQTILDFYIFKNGGGLNGTCISQAEPSQLQINTTYNASSNIYQTAKTPAPIQIKKQFWLLEQVNEEKIQLVIKQVIENSSQESVLSFKVHVKQLTEQDIDNMSEEHLKLIKQDIMVHDDYEYKRKMLQKMADLYLTKENYVQAVDCVILSRDAKYAAKFILDFLEQGKVEFAIQTAFNFQEKLPLQIVMDTQYTLNQTEQKSDILNLIVNEILSGKISTQLYLDFMQLNQHIDRSALRELTKSAQNAESFSACFSMHALMTISTLQYEHKENLVARLQKYPLLGFYSQIGLIFRGHYELPDVYKRLFDNIAAADPYKLGGAILGMAYQLVGTNGQDNNALIKLLELNDQVSTISQDKRAPVIYGLALASGLITLGQSSDEINKLISQHFGEDVDQNFGILLGLGLSNFGQIKFFQDEICQQVIQRLASEKERERQAAALCLAMMCYGNESKAEEIIQLLLNYAAQNQSQFSETAMHYAGVAIGLAYFQTDNVQQCQRLLLLANQLQRTQGAKLTIESLGMILKPTTQAFSLLQMCTRSFDSQVRAGACVALGQVFATSGNMKVVECLCKMMSDQDEQVRASAIIGQSFVLQSICGSEIPDAQKIEYTEPVGDRQKNTLYKCDYKDDAEWEMVKNQQKVLKTPSPLSERYKENYSNKLAQRLTLNEYTTQFRRDLVKEDEAHLLTQRAQMLSVGIMNAGGLNLSFKLQNDLHAAAHVLFLNSFTWFPLQSIIGLCFEPDFVSMVMFENGELQKVEPVLAVPNTLIKKHGYSVLSKEVKQTELEQYVQKARLSQQDLKDEKKSAQRFNFMRQVRDIAMEEFIRQANNVKLADVLAGQDKTTKEVEEDYEILQAPVRITEEMVGQVQMVTGGGYEVVFGALKRGVVVVREEE
ncbi:26S_proteasome regulatory subunit [Hexamita inflata]|uniref:26S proteasome regulatory subunit n=2 Tax=Hexamita inflata TaxID=28002 RepID=A0AA86PCT9_9EUKA|nr:26S proteasome regulatory subunit [Hexamita inflata]